MFICQESLYPGTVWHVFGAREDVSEGSGGMIFSIHASHLNHQLRCPLPGRQRRPITIQTCYYYHQRGGSAVFPAFFLSPKCLFMPRIRQRTLKSHYYRSWQGSHHTFIFHTLTWLSLWGVGRRQTKNNLLWSLLHPAVKHNYSILDPDLRKKKKHSYNVL